MTDRLTEFKENDIIECIDSFLIYVTLNLTAKELEVLNSRLGLNYRYYNNEKKSLQQIAEDRGISGVRMQKIVARIGRKLAYRFNEYIRRRIKYNITKQQKDKT
jgi:DNA-directed RNA polymerase sigma subunit (sigma70/sigma32)